MLSSDTRFVPMQEVFNFRDLGGYRGIGGRHVRCGVLYRADSLARLDGADLRTFVSLGFRTVLDLRDSETVRKHGRVPAFPGQLYVNVQPRNSRYGWEEYHDGMDLARFIADRYLDMAVEGATHFARALETLADSQRLPAVFHCQVGRDRTGVLAALVLALLGVGHDEIAADYAMSAEAELRFAAWQRARDPHAVPDPAHLVATPEQAMRLFLADLDRRYGGAAGYAHAAGLSAGAIEGLRRGLLQPSDCPGRTHAR
jgi:protein-tyrosine phosphatase